MMTRDRWLSLGVLLVQGSVWMVLVLLGWALGRRTTSDYVGISLLGAAVLLFVLASMAFWRGLGVTSVWDGKEDTKTLTWFGRLIAKLGTWWRRLRHRG